ncbi:hypothetical protein N7466_010597 [Penicillium verhagenii]|uniref:uncharacterized protein n=1 Tax=Penicillium verhagenii TaxID=1562060 RepID=UPI002545880C|nr:uncharacterized protein N7466_010597 [Penicillium verhagenii]KAJ5918605.1 hypothetical protein N7466_010597 [Penicillium verhagenii]
MLLKTILVLATATIGNVLAITNSQQTVDNINALTKKTQIAKQALENYNGGISGGLLIARAIYNAHSSAVAARNSMGSSDPFSGEDSDLTLDAYNQFTPVLLSALEVAQVKAPLVKNSGLAYPAQGMISNLYNEKSRFEEAMHGQLSNEHSLMIKPSVDQIDREFKKTLDSFSD